MTKTPPIVISQRNLSHKQSTRRLSHTDYLRSSEITPSEHSSLYDATPLLSSSQWRGSSSHSDNTQESTQALEDVEAAGRCALANSDRHVGTKLFTIVEQKSVPSLKRMPSNWEYQRRVFSLQPKLSLDLAQAQHSRMARRRCYSADDRNLYTRRAKREISITTSTEGTFESQSPGSDYKSLPAVPASPPYQQPRRIQTPTGLPRWPGEADHDQDAVQQLTVRISRRNLLIKFLRRPPSRPKLKEVLRGERTTTFNRAARTGTRFWRPPSSGHSTRRYDELASHPFSFVSIADSRGTEPMSRYEPTTEDESGPYDGKVIVQPSGGAADSVHTAQTTSINQPSVIGESLRVLRYTSQNAVPVSARRTSAHVSTRSAAVPAHFRNPSILERGADQTSQSPENDTMRTAYLFASFPPPPPGPQQQNQRVQVQKSTVWSLFPSSNQRADANQRQSRKRQDLTNPSESEVSNVAIRGESRARYRYSGTPIYDPEGVSLRSFDREMENSGNDNGQQPNSTTAIPLDHTEIEHAISNGALRFSTRDDVPPQATPITHTQPYITESQNPAVRKALEQRPVCRHKLAKFRSFQKKHPHLVIPTTYDTIHLDGTSTPSAPPILAHDHAFAGPSLSTQTRATKVPVYLIDRPPTTTTFAAAPNGATTYTVSPTIGPVERPTNLASVQTSSTMPGRA